MRNFQPRQCEFCGEAAARPANRSMAFPYGVGEDEVLLTAVVPMWVCGACDEVYADAATEDRQARAIAEYANRMRPSGIRRLRERAGLSQVDFADRVGVGPASVKRWEKGSSVPNRSLNLLLLDFERRLDAEEARSAGWAADDHGRWRTLAPSRRAAAAGAFTFALAA